ncbi:DNA-processing protein DprA [Nocardioides acrostichi]|uniref:DNA-protecting protein DprA n=1 Tax=Nocardioides acrostichi TaxID=2784339 RepID=A0A930YBG6_9ACTN|nr:DNA-processing protein DprA [Nocardioides acrostichi]MBF4160464.1 DNA-protecting protein DprA [Nocardioides acrostichi]
MSAPAPVPGCDDDRLARVALSYLTEPGNVRVNALAAEIGSVTLLEHLEEKLGPDSLDTRSRQGALRPERALAAAAKLGLRFVVPGDDEWPPALDDLARADHLHERGGVPLGLWVRGPARLDDLCSGPSVSVVGSRSATTYGTDQAAGLAHGAAAAGCAVVSGAAFGIDQAAHRGALSARGRTVAVLACGADRVYPQAHADLIGHLAAEHAVVSESPPGFSPTRIRFLSRNRLIAGLTRGTVVVEAAYRSGALNTANWAGRLGRPLMAVPGPVTSSLSAGAHELVRTGQAVLVTRPEHVLEVIGAAGEHLVEEPRDPDRPRDLLTPRQRQVLDAVPVVRAAAADSIARTAGIRITDVRGALDRLETAGLVERCGSAWRLAARSAQQEVLSS